MAFVPDKTDRKILRILQENARISLKEIASKLYMSSPAVSARIAKLEDGGVLLGYHASVSPAYLGYPIKAFVNVEVNPKQKAEFYETISAIPNVVECNFVTGDYSVLIEGFFRSTEDLEHFVYSVQHFGRTKTLISMSTPVPQRPLPIQTGDTEG